MTDSDTIPQDDRQAMLDRATEGTPVPPEVLSKLVGVESSWSPSKKNRDSGASGLGAVLTSTAARPGYGLDPLPPNATPQEQLRFSARYLAARGRALGMTDADWKDPQKVSAALSAYHGPTVDANGVGGADYARKVLGMPATDTATSLGAQPATSALGISPYGPGMVSETVRQMEASAKEKEQRTAPLYEEMRRNYERDQARFDKVADSYQPVRQTPPPTPPQNDPMQAFGSAAGMFAMLASAFTHTPAVNAMNGMAAAINASREGNQQSFENSMKQWKENTEIAIQNHKLQADDMKAAMDMMQLDLASGAAMVKAIAAQSDDKITLRLAEQGEWDKLSDHMQAASKMAQDMQINAPKAMAAVEYMNADAQLKAAQKSGDKTAIAAAQDGLDRAWARTQIVNTKTIRPPSAASIREKDADTLARDDFRQKHGRDPVQGDEAELAQLRNDKRADYASQVSGGRAIGNREAGLGLAVNELKRLAPLALEASDKVDRTQYANVNSVIEASQKGTGGENVVQLGLAIAAAKTAYAQVLKRGGATTDDAQRRADDVLNQAWSKGQIKAALEQIMRESEAAQKAIGDTRNELRGGGQTTQSSVPAIGSVMDGYRFKGGDPSSQSSWEKVNG